MKQLQEDLWQGAIHRSGMLSTHAYLLQMSEENVLVYNTSDNDDFEKIAELGGIQYQLLTHRDESGPSLKRIKSLFSSKLCCSALEALHISKDASVDIAFKERDVQLSDIEIIHTPDHTNGSICFFYKSLHGKSYLFTGDTIFQWDGQWSTLVLSQAGGNKSLLASSLLKLRDLNPDIVISSGFVGDVSFVEVTGHEWGEVIEDNVSRLMKDA